MTIVRSDGKNWEKTYGTTQRRFHE
jgi:hypothetical protein